MLLFYYCDICIYRCKIYLQSISRVEPSTSDWRIRRRDNKIDEHTEMWC